MRLELVQKVDQQLILAPQMILSMDILLLSSMDLEARVEQEFMENPALEMDESPGDPSLSPVEEAPVDDARGTTEEEIFAKLDAFADDEPRSPWSARHRGFTSDSGGADKLEALQNTEGRPITLQEHLVNQVHEMDLAPELVRVCEEIIHNLDDRGYLIHSPEEVWESLPAQDRDLMDEALDTVRSLEPAGVGARDLKECLLIQLRRDTQEYPLETRIIEDHLDDLGENRIPKIARELGVDVEDVKEAISIIAQLDPNPGACFAWERPTYIRPDVVVEKVDGHLEVRIEDGRIPHLSVSQSCRRLLREGRGDPQVVEFVRRKIESAQWLIQAIRQRQRTLHDISMAVVDQQHDFMMNGSNRLRAMKMQTIADAVGVHISTVSRAIKGKYMQTPWGIYEMRYFFTGGVARSDGEVESRRNVYRKIAEIIEREDKTCPYSDLEIAQILKEAGLNIARRTVTKYREKERIPPSRLRRVY